MRGRSALELLGVTALLAVALAFFLAPLLGLAGCGASAVERSTARAAVALTAEAARTLDVECARMVRMTGDGELGQRCEAVYRDARATLVGAAVSLDAWADVEAREAVPCIAANVARSLALLAADLSKRGGRDLAAVADAVSFVARFANCAEAGR